MGGGVPVLIEPNFVGRWLVQLLQMLGAHDDDGTLLVRLRGPFHGLSSRRRFLSRASSVWSSTS